MKRRKQMTRAQVQAAMEFQSIRPPALHRVWLIHWQNIEPTIKRYQEGVSLSRVLAEHHGAIAAQPMPEAEG